MPNKTSFEDRVAKAKSLSGSGNYQKALYQLDKCKEHYPEKSKEIKDWYKELKEKMKGNEEIVVVKKPLGNKIIKFIVTAPFMKNNVGYEVNDIIELPEDNDYDHVKPLKD